MSALGARRWAPRVAALLIALLCGGCGGATLPDPPPVPEPLDRIAAALGCRAEIVVDAEELREGACTVGAQPFRMATFSTAEGRGAWLSESRQYGGTYLVGDRWIVTAPSPASLTPAHTLLGGTLDSAPAHTHSHGQSRMIG